MAIAMHRAPGFERAGALLELARAYYATIACVLSLRFVSTSCAYAPPAWSRPRGAGVISRQEQRREAARRVPAAEAKKPRAGRLGATGRNAVDLRGALLGRLAHQAGGAAALL